MIAIEDGVVWHKRKSIVYLQASVCMAGVAGLGVMFETGAAYAAKVCRMLQAFSACSAENEMHPASVGDTCTLIH